MNSTWVQIANKSSTIKSTYPGASAKIKYSLNNKTMRKPSLKVYPTLIYISLKHKKTSSFHSIISKATELKVSFIRQQIP